MTTTALTVLVLAAGLMIGLGVYGYIKLLTHPQLERYNKLRMQGPFVPLPKDELTKP
jgi:hypothetical protein